MTERDFAAFARQLLGPERAERALADHRDSYLRPPPPVNGTAVLQQKVWSRFGDGEDGEPVLREVPTLRQVDMKGQPNLDPFCCIEGCGRPRSYKWKTKAEGGGHRPHQDRYCQGHRKQHDRHLHDRHLPFRPLRPAGGPRIRACSKCGEVREHRGHGLCGKCHYHAFAKRRQVAR